MFKAFRKKIGIIGYGNMGSAIADKIKPKYSVFVFDKDKEKTRNLKDIAVSDDIHSLLAQSQAVILAVKPQDFEDALDAIKAGPTGKLIISIAAGIPTGYIERILPGARVIRVMPNIAVKIREAESCLCKGKNATHKDISFSQKLFNSIGKTWLMEEATIDAATAISGSGPAYIYYDMEIKGIDPKNIPAKITQEYISRLKKAAEVIGFDSETAFTLASSTVISACHLVEATGLPPSELRRQITSKGGTTEAALRVLADNGSWEEAALAAKRRAQELSKKESSPWEE